jgi:hypothetical protein
MEGFRLVRVPITPRPSLGEPRIPLGCIQSLFVAIDELERSTSVNQQAARTRLGKAWDEVAGPSF